VANRLLRNFVLEFHNARIDFLEVILESELYVHITKQIEDQPNFQGIICYSFTTHASIFGQQFFKVNFIFILHSKLSSELNFEKLYAFECHAAHIDFFVVILESQLYIHIA